MAKTISRKIIGKVLGIIPSSYTQTVLKRLDYDKDSKLLIIHDDDLGFSVSENNASIEALEKGLVNSASIMVPCPNFKDIADYARDHPTTDFGIHLTLTSEWNKYKWGPVSEPNEVASLIGPDGYFYSNPAELLNKFKISEVEQEFHAQIQQALNSGIRLTHIDSHMLVAFSHIKIQNLYLKMGKVYKLPVLLNLKMSIPFLKMRKLLLIDNLLVAEPKHWSNGLINYYREVLNSIKPGLSCILIHTAFYTNDMLNFTNEELNYGARWRQIDFDFFTSSECKQLIQNNNIKLVSWKEIRDKLFHVNSLS